MEPTFSASRFYFVDIPRTGSTNFRDALGVNNPRHLLARERRRLVDDWREAFTFATVRNPYDRAVSLWGQIESTPRGDDLTFEEHVQKYYVDKKWDDVQVDYWENLWKPQWEWVSENGDMIVDHVGRFENLHTHFDYVTSVIGLEVKLPHPGQDKYDKTRNHYNANTKRIIREYFDVDFKKFGYD